MSSMNAGKHLLNPVLTQAVRSLTHFFGTRHGPVVGDTREDVGVVRAKHPEYPLVIQVKQVHGTDALVLDSPMMVNQELPGGWDALITNQSEVLLAVRTADCVPVLVYDSGRHIVAAIHAGWRGSVQGIVPATLHRMQECFDTQMEDVLMAIGPSAGFCCYEVDEPVIRSLRASYQEWAQVVVPRDTGKVRLNLRELIRCQALDVGVPEHGIGLMSFCTICQPDLFYSYRRDGSANKTMVSGIMLTRVTC